MNKEARSIRVNGSSNKFCPNIVKNTKYTALNFVLKNFYEQVSQPMNCYLLCIAILQMFPQITVNNPWATWAPLVFIFSFSAFRELSDDIKRAKADKKENNRLVRVVRGDKIEQIMSKQIRVGDVLYLTEGEEILCDCTILYSSNPNGMCYIQTANIDGETNLKLRFSSPSIQQYMSLSAPEAIPGLLSSIEMTLLCPAPSTDVYDFPAVLSQTVTGGSEIKESLSSSNMLLQVCYLRNTQFVYAVATYTGNETKFGMNKDSPKLKLTYIDRRINLFTLVIFLFQLIMIAFFSPFGILHISSKEMWYMDIRAEKKAFITYLRIPFRYLLLNCAMIPISMKVTIEMCKIFYAAYIDKDEHFKNPDPTKMEKTDRSVYCKSSCLSENLGQVKYSYIMTDKTGTLTKNELTLKFMNVFHKEIVIQEQMENMKKVTDEFQTTIPYQELLRCILLCNSVLIDKDSVMCDSSDEICLVNYCKYLGGTLLRKEGNVVTISINGKEEIWVIVKYLEFTSERKRMSVLTYSPINRVFCMYSKGADDVLFSRCLKTDIYCGKVNSTLIKELKEDVKKYANQGLRTLVFGRKEMDKYVFDECAEEISQVEQRIEQRDKEKQKCYDRIEREIQLLGVSGVEDMLQDGVEETIRYLCDCGIHVWMITGDKSDTAISVGKSAGIIRQDGTDSVLVLSTEENCDCESLLIETEKTMSKHEKQEYVLCVSGSFYSDVVASATVPLFLYVISHAKSLVFYRVLPKQKAEIVDMIKNGLHKITLAIGDGGNDVSMIQKSDVGVGIIGKEGHQAAAAADYVISEFKHLKRLLCVHGVNSVSRSWAIANYSFYKSIVFCIAQTMFSFYCDFSGVSLMNSYHVVTVNVFLSFAVSMVITKQAYSHAQLLNDSSIYQYFNNTDPNNKRTLFTVFDFVKWFILGVLQGSALVLVCVLSSPSATFDYLTNTIYHANYFAEDLIILFLVPNVTLILFGVVTACHVLMFAVNYVVAMIPEANSFIPYMSLQYTMQQPLHYWVLFIDILLPLTFFLGNKIFGNRKKQVARY